MPANKINYVVAYRGYSQVFGANSKEVALSSPPPDGYSIEDKRVYFLALEPDNDRIVWREVPEEEIQEAELKYPKPKAKKDD